MCWTISSLRMFAMSNVGTIAVNEKLWFCFVLYDCHSLNNSSNSPDELWTALCTTLQPKQAGEQVRDRFTSRDSAINRRFLMVRHISQGHLIFE